MLIHFFYLMNGILLGMGLLVFRLKRGEQQFSLAVVQSLFLLPLLAGEYVYLSKEFSGPALKAVFMSEGVFVVIWLALALRLKQATSSQDLEPRLLSVGLLLLGAFLPWMGAIQSLAIPQNPLIPIRSIVFPSYSLMYFNNLALLIGSLVMVWRLEVFYRGLLPAYRWEFKFFSGGGYLVCAVFIWAASYRITYLRLVPDHYLLMALLLLLAWVLMGYAVARHRLLNRKMFVSRKVVYRLVAPLFFAGYLFSLGLLSLIIRHFGWELPFVVGWFVLAVGAVAILILIFSGKVRYQVKYFISTHFYVNKYEYRDEWLAFSELLQEAFTESEIIEALRQVLSGSLYTTNIVIWAGDEKTGFKPVPPPGHLKQNYQEKQIAVDDSLNRYLKDYGHFNIQEAERDKPWQEVMDRKRDQLKELNLVLITPLAIGDQVVGIVGLGPEFTGGRYGHDDYDLLSALGTQAAAALLAARTAGELARTRQREALDTLSAFVLHDIKNAANMLSLVQKNAPDHIHNPEFQQDMLETVDHALKRMAKVQDRLKGLKGEFTPVIQQIELGGFLRDHAKQMAGRLPGLRIQTDCPEETPLETDPDLLSKILENLLINSLEAGGEGTEVMIKAGMEESVGKVMIEFSDNGPGIRGDLLPTALFEPFSTSKSQGSGIGLWHVKRMVDGLKAKISAENQKPRGGCFKIVFSFTRKK